jgi:yopX protein
MEFKIWDKVEKVYLENDNENAYFLNMNGKLYKMNFRLDTLEELPKERYVILKNIGTLDVNSKETFEGDIVKWQLEYSDKEEYSEVIYDDYLKCYCIYFKKENGIKIKKPIHTLKTIYGVGYKIIGNIFSNIK